MNFTVERCPVFHDKRGDIVQFITNQILNKAGLAFGQIYIVTFAGKGVVRGNHFHNQSSEIFCLVTGTVEVVLEDVQSKERFRQVYEASGNEFVRIALSEKIAHAIRSISDFAVVVGYNSIEYNPLQEDKIPYRLL